MTTARLKFDFLYGRLLLDRELQFSFSECTNTQSGRFRIFFLCVCGGGGGDLGSNPVRNLYKAKFGELMYP